ncbi:MAG: isoprenylcysteine carboxylmethyltransferase family protein [Gammaproteobacteria bacterium]|nr:isoprenylcysteine carboxylmethyltransferase family protein [Gammaproteobacteria bacterium]
MSRILVSLYGVVSYIVFFLSFLYAIAFVGNIFVPKTIDSGDAGPVVSSVIINMILLGLFAIQHSVMARPAFKHWFTRFIPEVIERSTYVLLSSLLLFLLFWQWQKMPGIIWNIKSPVGSMILTSIFWFGWLFVLLSTFMINHFDLFGLRQVYINFKGQEYSHLDFRIIGLYKLCRHPIMLGFVIAFWATPTMTTGHLLFAAVTTVYIYIALQFEERDLVTFFGDVYKNYQQKVPMLFPFKW